MFSRKLLADTLSLVLPVGAAHAAPPKDADIDAAIVSVTGEAAVAIDEAAAEDARTRALLEQREAELSAARSRLEAARVRVNQEEVGIKAVDLELKAVGATEDTAAQERLATERARLEQRRRWRIEQRSQAQKEVVLSQKRVAEARTEVKLAAARLKRAKLAAWVDLGADADVDKALATESRKVAGARRALERDQRRTERATQNRDTASQAAASLAPESLEGRLAEAQAEAQRLQGELGDTKATLEEQQAAVERLGKRLTEEREAGEADRERLATLEDSLAKAGTEAASASTEAQRAVEERDQRIAELQARVDAKRAPRPEDDLAELQAELEAVTGERDRLAAVASAAEEDRTEAGKTQAALEARLTEAEQARAAAEQLAEDAGRRAGESEGARVTELEAALKRTEEERDSLQAKLEQGADADESVRAIQVEMLRKRLESGEELSRRRIAGLEDELQTKSEALVATEQRLARASEEADRLAVDLARAEAASGDGERVQQLEAELADARAALDARLAALNELESGDRDGAMRALQEEADGLREQLLAAERATTAAQATAEERALRLSEVDAELKIARDRLNEAKAAAGDAERAGREAEDAAKASADAEIAALTERAESAESRLVAAEAELKAGAARRTELAGEVDSLQAALQEGGKEARLEELEGRVEDLAAERDALADRLEEAKSFAGLEMEVLRGQVEAFSEGIVEAEARVAEKDARIAELSEAVDAAERARRDDSGGLRAELRVVRAENDRRKAELTDLEARLREATRRLGRLQSENEGLWAKVDASMDWEEPAGE